MAWSSPPLAFVSLLCLASFLLPGKTAFASNETWAEVDQVLLEAISDEAFPGCVAIVGAQNGTLYAKTFGNYTYGVPPPFSPNSPMKLSTLYDMASCTKVVATTSAIAQFYQRGELNLHAKIADVVDPAFAANGKQNISVLNCLLHNAGFPPDPVPNYWNITFGCPQTHNEHPKEVFSCQNLIYESWLKQTLVNPIGSVYVYSDLRS